MNHRLLIGTNTRTAVTPNQLREAMHELGNSTRAVEVLANVSRSTVIRLCSSSSDPPVRSFLRVRHALEARGVRFGGDAGVRMTRPPMPAARVRAINPKTKE